MTHLICFSMPMQCNEMMKMACVEGRFFRTKHFPFLLPDIAHLTPLNLDNSMSELLQKLHILTTGYHTSCVSHGEERLLRCKLCAPLLLWSHGAAAKITCTVFLKCRPSVQLHLQLQRFCLPLATTWRDAAFLKSASVFGCWKPVIMEKV